MRPILSIIFFLLIMAASTDKLAETKMSLNNYKSYKTYRTYTILTKFNPKLTILEIYAICSLVEKYSILQEIDPYLVMAIIIVESSGRPFAVSPKGAIGLMQIMPHMAEELGLDADLFDIDTNIRLGTFILADNIQRWGYHKGIERYFWGTGAADGRYISKVLKVMEGFKG